VAEKDCFDVTLGRFPEEESGEGASEDDGMSDG